MLLFSLEVTRMDRIRIEGQTRRLRERAREARLRRFRNVQRRNSEYIGRRMLHMELPGRRQRGRPKRRFMDAVRGHAGRSQSGRYNEQVELENSDSLWQPLKRNKPNGKDE